MRKLYRVLMALPLVSLSINVCLAQDNPLSVERSIQKTPEKFKEFKKAQEGEDYYLLVTFDELPGQKEISKLQKYQIELLEYRSKNTYLAAIPANLNPTILSDLKIKSVGEVRTEAKMDERLLAKDYPAWTRTAAGSVDLAIVFHTKATTARIQKFLKKYNATILEDKHRGNTTVVARVAENKIEALAASPLVAFVDVKQEPAQILNHEVRINQKVNVLNSVLAGGYNLHGKGVTVGVGDGGQLGAHIDFGNRVTNKANGTYSSFGDHGDHVTGIIGGAGNLNPRHQGIAPECNLLTQKTSQITYNVEDYINDFGMVLTNNSYGTSFNCNTNGSYNYSAQTLDWQLREYPSILHVFAAGNSGRGHCEPYPVGYRSVLRYYQSAKNVLTVGMAEEDRTIAQSSSRGPVLDGRLKPEIIGLGRNVVSTSREYNYTTKGGSSMSAPAVTGTLALLIEQYRKEHNNNNPDGALLKAIACNTADDLGNSGPDYIYGFGLINGLRAVEVIKENQFYSDELVNGETDVQAINVAAGVKQVKIMLYWPDKEAAVYPDKALVNDLNISIIAPNGETVLPWVLDPSAEGVANLATRGVDTLNNIEQITIDNPISGTYTVVVKGASVPFGPQKFYTTYDFIKEEVMVTHPFGTESFVPGTQELISWEADITNTNTFRLEFSLDGGNTWLEIAPAVPANKRNYSWTVPMVYSPDAIIRVSKNGTSISGQNTAYFSIMNAPTDLVATPTCEQYMMLEWTPSDYTIGYEVCMFDGEKMVVVGTTEETSYVIEEAMDLDTDYWFAVRGVDMEGNASQRATAVSAIPEDIELCPWDDNPVLQYQGETVWGRVGTETSLTDTETISISVKNIGSNDLQSFKMYYSINGGTPVEETFNGLIESGETQLIDFTTKADLSGVGTYHVDTWLKIEGNNSMYMDSLMSVFYGEQIVNSPVLLPFQETFSNAVSNTYNQDILGINGCVKWDLQTQGQGELEVQKGNAIFLRPKDITSPQIPLGNKAIMTVNMSQYADMREEVELSMDYKLDLDVVPFTAMPFENTLSIRGKDTESWIVLQELDRTEVEWQKISGINLTKILKEHGQAFSTSFQIKFTNDNDLPFALANILLDIKEEFVYIPEDDGTIADDFTAILIGEIVKLKWRPIKDYGIRFEIEVIEDFNNNQFDVIGTIDVERTTTEPYFYTFTDGAPGKEGIRYYRIKQTNADGSIHFSPLLSVTMSEPKTEEVFPNPFVDHVNITYEASEANTIQVLIQNQDGRIIQANQVDVMSGTQIIPIDLGKDQAPGMYFLKIIDGKRNACQKIVKLDTK